MKDNKEMVTHQPEHADCEKMKEQKQESNLWYYDGIRIFHQIAQYTKDDSWLKVSAKCRGYFRDDYVIGCVKYSTPPWRNFTLGLYYDWIVLNDERSKETAIEVLSNPVDRVGSISSGGRLYSVGEADSLNDLRQQRAAV